MCNTFQKAQPHVQEIHPIPLDFYRNPKCGTQHEPDLHGNFSCVPEVAEGPLPPIVLTSLPQREQRPRRRRRHDLRRRRHVDVAMLMSRRGRDVVVEKSTSFSVRFGSFSNRFRPLSDRFRIVLHYFSAISQHYALRHQSVIQTYPTAAFFIDFSTTTITREARRTTLDSFMIEKLSSLIVFRMASMAVFMSSSLRGIFICCCKKISIFNRKCK